MKNYLQAIRKLLFQKSDDVDDSGVTCGSSQADHA